MIDKSKKISCYWHGENAEDIKEFLKCFTEAGYIATQFDKCKCKKCGSDIFKMESKQENQLYRLICALCEEIQYIENSNEFWEEDDERITKMKCKNKLKATKEKCGCNTFNIVLGYALIEESKNWCYVGYICQNCKVLGCFDDIHLR